MKRWTLTLALAAMCVPALAQKVGNSDLITPDRLKAHLYFVADDLLEGRNTPSRGLDIACLYVQTQLKLWGVKPMGDNGGYLQHIPMRAIGFDVASCALKVGDSGLRYGFDYRGDGGNGTASGQVVVIGSGGYEDAKQNVDPYKGVDVKGKIVLISGAPPEGFETQRADRPEVVAQKHGAVGVMMVPRRFQADAWRPDDFLRSSVGYTLAGEGAAKDTALPRIVLSKSGLASVAGGADKAEALINLGYEREQGKSYALDATASFTLSGGKDNVTATNVVGYIEGSDPVLKKEFVALGGHIDHLGMRSGTGDVVYNGADDDGSGTVSVLEIAHAFSMGVRPKRSLLFVWHCGEEKGLWGSSYFVNHPTVDLKSIICQLNIDMIGRSKKAGDTNPANAKLGGPNDVYIIGSRRMSSVLGATAKAVNSKFWNLKYDEFYDRPNDPESLFSRSDHYNYAAKGIPILFWFDGIHEDYHQVSDEPSKIDYVKMSKIAQSVYATALAMGNAAKRPKVDLPIELK